MLLGVSYEVINSVVISLVYDDSSVKKQEVCVGDVVNLSYNKNGMKKTVEGKVVRIYTDNNHHGHNGHASCHNCVGEGCYILIDSSEPDNSNVTKVDVDMILELSVLSQVKVANNITSPGGEYNVTSMRLVGNQLQISNDYGKSWMAVCTLPESDIIVEDEDDLTLAQKIAALIPKCAHPHEKQEAVTELLKLFREEQEEDPQNPNT